MTKKSKQKLLMEVIAGVTSPDTIEEYSTPYLSLSLVSIIKDLHKGLLGQYRDTEDILELLTEDEPPKYFRHKAKFIVEVTALTKMNQERFGNMVAGEMLKAEAFINKDCKIRAHITHEDNVKDTVTELLEKIDKQQE